MIKRLEIENFGCIRRAEVQPTPLHALVGPSDAGKSTILKAVAALACFSASDEQPPGSSAPLVPRKAREALSLTVEFAGSVGFNLGFAPRSQLVETHIRESMHGAWLPYRTVAPDFSWASQAPAQLADFAAQLRRQLSHEVVELEASALIHGAPSFVDGAPASLGRAGAGLAAVYERIMARSDDSFERISQRMRGLFPWIGGFEVATEGEGRKVLRVRTLDGQRVPARHVGVGVLRLLAWEALRVIDRPPLLLVEAPESGLSPALIARVVAHLRALTVDSERPTQVLVATRSPLVVAELAPREVSVVTRRLPEGTQVVDLAGAPDYVAAAGRLPRGQRWLDLADGVAGGRAERADGGAERGPAAARRDEPVSA